jgi:hypothetical protein
LIRPLLLVLALATPALAQDVARVDSGVYPLALWNGAPYIELDVGGARGYFLVDTGANTSGVDKAWLERSGGRFRPGRRSTVGGTTGPVAVESCIIDRLDLGTGFFRDAGFALQSFERFAHPAPSRPQVGLLGTDFLEAYQVAFDWPNARLTLRLASERTTPPPGHEAIACAFPIHLPTITVEVAGLSLPCRLDTGATYLRGAARLDVNEAAVEALRARGVALVERGSLTVRGVGGPERLPVLGLADAGLAVDIGPARLDDVLLVVHRHGTLAVRHPLSLASGTLLARLHRLIIDPFDGLVWVPIPEPRTGPRLGPL